MGTLEHVGVRVQLCRVSSLLPLGRGSGNKLRSPRLALVSTNTAVVSMYSHRQCVSISLHPQHWVSIITVQ